MNAAAFTSRRLASSTMDLVQTAHSTARRSSSGATHHRWTTPRGLAPCSFRRFCARALTETPGPSGFTPRRQIRGLLRVRSAHLTTPIQSHASQRFGALRNPPVRETRGLCGWLWGCGIDFVRKADSQGVAARNVWDRFDPARLQKRARVGFSDRTGFNQDEPPQHRLGAAEPRGHLRVRLARERVPLRDRSGIAEEHVQCAQKHTGKAPQGGWCCSR